MGQKYLLKNSIEEPLGNFDLICIGTPRLSHKIGFKALEERPGAVLIEKPLTSPDLSGCQELFDKSKQVSILHLLVMITPLVNLLIN